MVVGNTRFRTHCHCGWCPLRLVTLGERGHFGGCILLYVGTQRGPAQWRYLPVPPAERFRVKG